MPAKHKSDDLEQCGTIKRSKPEKPLAVRQKIYVPPDEGFRAQSKQFPFLEQQVTPPETHEDEGTGIGAYVDKEHTVYDVMLNQTNIGKNNNKVC